MIAVLPSDILALTTLPKSFGMSIIVASSFLYLPELTIISLPIKGFLSCDSLSLRPGTTPLLTAIGLEPLSFFIFSGNS